MPRARTIDERIDDLCPERPQILLAEDDAEMRALLVAQLSEDGHDVVEAQNGVELVRAIHRLERARGSIHLIITDVRMPGFDGIEVLEYVRYAGLAVPVIVMTAFGDAGLHARAREHGAALVLDKPFDVDDLRDAIARIAPSPRAA